MCCVKFGQWPRPPSNWVFSSLHIVEVAEELCKTASSGHCGPLHSFSHDMPLLPSKSRTLHKHTENKENIEGGLDGRPDHSTHGHSGTARHAYLTTNQSGLPRYDSAGMPANVDSESTLQRRRARRLKRRAVIFLNNWPSLPASVWHPSSRPVLSQDSSASTAWRSLHTLANSY